MTIFTLKRNPTSGLYAVYENGVKVKNDIFTDAEDFRGELEALEFDKSYEIKVEE